MRILPTFLALVTLLAPAMASAAPQSEPPLPVERQPAMVDRLFPETAIEGEGWRGLLPVMLMNQDVELRRAIIRIRTRETATR